MARNPSKGRRANVRSRSSTKSKRTLAVPTNAVIASTAQMLSDEAVESALVAGDQAGLLEDYFGEEEYEELRELARLGSTRSLRDGPRVLILPGIMGSTIGRERTLWPDDIIWFDPFDIAAGNLKRLRLNGAGSRFKPLGVILLAYLKLKFQLIRAGYDVDYHPFDWRKSLKTQGQELVTRLKREKKKQVHLVGHSMGGLLARSALAQGAPKVKSVVMLGTPNYGSFAPVQALRATYSVVRKVAFIDLHHSAEELATEVFRSFPGLYEMLPWPEKFDHLKLYDLATWPKTGPRPLQRLLTAAPLVQQSLAAADERFFLIAGINRETVVGARRSGDQFIYDYSIEGDGTVPLAFAKMDGAKTYYVEELHGSLPNNNRVAAAIADILASGSTSVLSDQWVPTRAGVTRSLGDNDFQEPVYQGTPGRSLSLREQRFLLEEFASPTAQNEQDIGYVGATPRGTIGYDHEFESVVIGRRRQHRLDIRLAFGSITEVDARAYVLGMFRDVAPSGPARMIDEKLDGTVTELMTRRMFSANVGEITTIPTGRHPIQADMVVFAGLGHFDSFGNDVLELAAENLIRTFVKTKVEDLATVLFGGASGQSPQRVLEHMLKGFFRGLCDTDTDHRFRSVTICETDRERYDAIKRELYRLSSTPLFDDIEVTIDEFQLPQPIATPPVGIRAGAEKQPVYLIVRREKSQAGLLSFESSILTAGSKATVVKGRTEVRQSDFERYLKKIETSQFAFDKLQEFGAGLGELVLSSEIIKVLTQFAEHHLVVVHDGPSSRIPWETLSLGQHFPALEGGLSRRYVADNMSIAKWLEARRHGPTLDLLLVVDPTQDLPGAVEEGKKIRELFDRDTSAVNVHPIVGSEARKSTLLSSFSSGKYDVIHYAGHAYFDEQVPARSGIICHNNEVLSGADLAGIGNLPSLVFFNACEAGRIRRRPDRKNKELEMEKRIQRNIGLAEAFLRGGVANYVGTYWPVGDAAAFKFAKSFYGELLRGEPIGQALLEGRREIRDLRSVDWADYILYGSADFVVKFSSD